MRWSLGTQGWSYADWVGTMYDAAARPGSFLRAYAEEFATVEIDSTFYGTPAVERVRRWAATVPDGFTFSCKLSREITHERRLVEANGLIAEFYDAMRAFGPRLGCVLVQFEASYLRENEEPVFRATLDTFPRDVRTAFEFRDPAWYAPDVQGLLESRGHALAVTDAPFVPRDVMAGVLRRTTVPFVYLRLIGVHDAFERFDRVQLDRTSIYSREILGCKKPRVGMLSNGTEANKGTELTQEASRLCKMIDLNFIGNVEGHDLFNDRVDVVVCDGFIGNIVLKTLESFAKGLSSWLKLEITKNPKRLLGAWLAKGAFRTMRGRIDPDTRGGAPLLGLNGIVFKAHGSAKERAIMNGIGQAVQAVEHHLTEIIRMEAAQANLRISEVKG